MDWTECIDRYVWVKYPTSDFACDAEILAPGDASKPADDAVIRWIGKDGYLYIDTPEDSD